MAGYVFFDFFGTLADYDPSIHPEVNAPLAFARRVASDISRVESDARWQRAWDELDAQAARTGREFSMEQVARRYWRSIGSPPLRSGGIEQLVDEYLDAWTANVAPAAHALECVTDLASDHTLAVVSNTHDPRLVPRLIRRFGLLPAIGDVTTSVDVGWRKPHRAIFEAALRRHSVDARDVVFVGDNWAADIEGPRAVGMSAVYVGHPTDSRAGVSLTDLPDVVRSLG